MREANKLSIALPIKQCGLETSALVIGGNMERELIHLSADFNAPTNSKLELTNQTGYFAILPYTCALWTLSMIILTTI